MLNVRSATVIGDAAGTPVAWPQVPSLSYRSERMPPCFANAVKAGAAVMTGSDPATVRACYFGSYWGPAALAKTYYERVLNGASAETLPLMFQNTTVSVALGQLAIEIGLTCPLYSLNTTPSTFLSTVLDLARCELAREPGTVLIVASDEAPDWLSNARTDVTPGLRGARMPNVAAAIRLDIGTRSAAVWQIRGVAVTPRCALDDTTMSRLNGGGAAASIFADTYVLQEDPEIAGRAVRAAAGDPGRVLSLGFVDASLCNSLLGLATACASAPGGDGPASRLICARCSDGSYVWIAIEWT